MIPVEQLDSFVKKYDATFRDVGTVFLSHVDEVLTSEAVLVDVGCGRTSYGEEVYKKAAKRIGLDIDPYAKENPLMDKVVIMTDEHFPLPDACADVVTAQWVVEHVVHPDIFLAEIHRVLKPGGVFVFMTTNIRSPAMWPSLLLPTRLKALFRSRVLNYASDETFPTMYVMNTPKKLQALAKKHGFSIRHLERIESFGYFRFSRWVLWAYIKWSKLLHLLTRDRHMHLVGVFVKQ